MAVYFADARKSHILQDFRFPQKFPQGDLSGEALSFADDDLTSLQKLGSARV
jgi:hypothetical protein